MDVGQLEAADDSRRDDLLFGIDDLDVGAGAFAQVVDDILQRPLRHVHRDARFAVGDLRLGAGKGEAEQGQTEEQSFLHRIDW